MTLDWLIERATQYEEKTVAVVAADDVEVIEAVIEALRLRIANFFLYGDKEQILSILREKPRS